MLFPLLLLFNEKVHAKKRITLGVEGEGEGEGVLIKTQPHKAIV